MEMRTVIVMLIWTFEMLEMLEIPQSLSISSAEEGIAHVAPAYFVRLKRVCAAGVAMGARFKVATRHVVYNKATKY